MIFSLGNLLIIFVVLIILVIYRALDRNNRSLEKVKRFSDKIRDSLAALVEEKTAEMKNLSIELGVNLKTGKEVLKRVREVEEELSKKASGVGEINARLAGYDKSLAELVDMTARVDENLKRVQAESLFVDKVGKRIGEVAGKLERMEKDTGRVEDKLMEQNRQALEALRAEQMAALSEQVRGLGGMVVESEKRVKGFGVYLGRLEAQASEAVRQEFAVQARSLAGEREAERAKAQAELAELEAEVKELEAGLGELKSSAYRNVSAQLEAFEGQVDKRIGEVAGKLERVEQDAGRVGDKLVEQNRQALEALRAEQMAALSEQVRGLGGMVVESEKRVKDFGVYIGRLEARGGELEQERLKALAKGFEQLELEARGRRAGLLKEFVGSLNKLLGEAEARGVQLKGVLAEAVAAVQEKLGGQQQWVEEMERLKAEAARRMGQAAEELEVGVLKRVEQSMEGYERQIEYRFQKLESAGADIEVLEANLRQAMERASEAVRQEFAVQARSLAGEREAERAKAQAELAELEAEVKELEAGLEELKSSAYQNVSVKLEVFEEGFIKNLSERSAGMEERLGAFQAELEARMGEISTGQSEEREALERRYSEELKRELERARGAAAEELNRLEARSAEFQAAVGERVNSIEKRVTGMAETLPAQIEGIRQEAQVRFRKELAALDQAAGGEIQRLRKDMENAAGAIRQEFASQSEELIAATSEERSQLKDEFQTIQERISQLEAELTSRSERALEEFRADWETFQSEFIGRTKEAQAEMEGRMREVKTRLAEMREKAEGLQTGLFGKIEEGHRTLSAVLADMDKRVKTFSAQTKLFERSDELKVQLEARIEEMKRDAEKLAVHHKEIEDMEGRLAAARRVTEELGGKLGRLLSERGKVEGMDSDFRKLLNLSKDLDQRLDTVNSSQDALQEIQAKIRELETLEKSTEGRFERLEKKKAILENTISGVDKNFQQLTELEKSLEVFKSEASSLGTALAEIRAQAEILSSNKEKSDQVVRRVSDLDGILADLEGRMGKLEKAREWLAKTETRFEHIGKQAQEQVKLLESILKAEKKQSKGEEGAPGLDKRDTVIKLAHLGWSAQEIARTTRLSRGEVELILELAPKQ
jgi:DNA repair exonuclease SbcCD ATPase subunit